MIDPTEIPMDILEFVAWFGTLGATISIMLSRVIPAGWSDNVKEFVTFLPFVLVPYLSQLLLSALKGLPEETYNQVNWHYVMIAGAVVSWALSKAAYQASKLVTLYKARLRAGR